VEKFGVAKFPTLVLLLGGDREPVVYKGDFKKEPMLKFLSQAGEPNPDPAPAKAKADKKPKAEKQEKKEKRSKSTSATSETASDESSVTESATTASSAPSASTEPIPILKSAEELTKECLDAKSGICVLALVPASHRTAGDKALTTLAELAAKHTQAKRHIFPFFEVPSDNPREAEMRKALELKNELEVIALHARRGWWRHYSGDFGTESVESWIDAIRMSEGVKMKLPESLVTAATAESEVKEPAADSATLSETKPTSESAETPGAHDEL
jgi:protein disulfide-isomerase A6